MPEAGPRDVLVEVGQCGICGTDVHLVLEQIAAAGHRAGPRVGGHDRRARRRRRGLEGRRSGGVRPDARVRRLPRVPRRPTVGVPRPTAHRPPRLPRRVRAVRRRPGGAAPRGARRRCRSVQAALVEPTAVALHAVTLSGATPDDRVLVTGAGPVGMLVTAVLHAQGVARRDRVGAVAGPAGARAAGGRGPGRRAARAAALADGRAGRRAVPVVFECSGRADAAESAIDQLDFAGTCVLVGTGHDLPRINHNRVIVLENTIIGSYNYDAGGFGPALDLLASGAMPLDALAEPVRRVARRAAGRVMRRCAAGELPGKVMVRPIRSEETSMSAPTFAPRLNHVAITMPPGELDDAAPRRDQGLLRRRVRVVRRRQQR